MTPCKSIVAALLAVLANAGLVGAAFADTLTVTKTGSDSGTVTSNVGAINCGAICTDTYADGTPITLTAAPAAGSQFTGWLGPCTGTGTCQFTISGTTIAVATFAPTLLGAPTLNIDGTTSCDALTDGLLVIRYLFGLSGTALIDGAVGAGASRNTAPLIDGYLTDIRPVLDIDGNGQADALTDGLLFIRYLFGLRGASLIAGVVGPGATRATAPGIETRIQSLCLPAAPTYTLSVSITGIGSGTVTSSPPGIACGADCTEAYSDNTVVTLSATPSADSTFSNWGNACAGTGLCVVTMDAAKSVSANFTLNSTVAPPIDPTVATDIFSATAFLYTGISPIQTRVAPGTIDARRAAVLRGKVQTRAGAALSGVTIAILAHPEFGQTLSRADGAFDLAVNGGGLHTVNYQKTGFLPVQRQVKVPWRNYTVLPDVVMIPLDAQVTPINLNAATMQVAQGSTMSDADGARRATILFPQGTTATMVLPNGTTQPLTTLNVRATEYTVGTNGPSAMPGELPPSSGYTFAVELSVDEAMAAGATEVRFGSPVPFYLENFVGFPVGSLVPTGFYDRGQGLWVAADNGRVIKVVSISGGLADLDLDGNGVIDDAAALAALGVTDDERQRLASLYTPGQELWRVLIPHFSPWDYNWPYGPPPGSLPPGDSDKPKPGPKPGKPPKGGPEKDCGSIIGCESQTLGEVIKLTGSPLSLHYQSDRAPGRRDTVIRLSGATLTPGLQRIHLEIAVAGRLFKQSFPPQANLVYTFTWDGKDAYGRPLQGRQPVNVRIGYEYIAQYYATPGNFAASFNRFGSPPIAIGAGGGGGGSAVVFSRPPVRTTSPPIILWQDYSESRINGGTRDSLSLGGWSLSVHHAYDVGGSTLYLGNGDRRSSEAAGVVINTVAGNGNPAFAGDGGPATQGQLKPQGIAVGVDGSLYVADFSNNRVRRVGPDGTITTVAGTGVGGFAGDGGPATQAQIGSPLGVAVESNGDLYIADYENNRIRRVRADGIITTVAGTGVGGFAGDGGPAIQAKLNTPRDVAVGSDGSLYIADTDNRRVRRVGSDGIITTVAGAGDSGSLADGGLATLAYLSSPRGLATGSDGSLYIADFNGQKIRRMGSDGIITTVAGTGVGGLAGDGGLATQAQLSSPVGVAVGADGGLYIAELNSHRIRRVGSDGIMTSVAGIGGLGGFAGDGGPATRARLNFPGAVSVGTDGGLYIADTFNFRVRKIQPSLLGFVDTELVIAAEDGSELYFFTDAGRHLRTLDILTGAVRFQFGYSSAARLVTITDGDGNVTTIERDGSGNPTAIVAPFGQRTTLAVQGDGYLSSVTNPAAEAVQLTYNSGNAEDLLATLTDPRGNVHRYFYDAVGRLVRDENPAGGVKTLARTDITDDHYAVSVTTASGLVTTHEVEELSTGDTRRVRISPSGARTETLFRTDGSSQVTYPDGAVVETVTGPDPRFGMQAPILKSQTLTTPSGKTQIITRTQSVTLANPSDLLSLSTLTRTLTIDGRTTTTNYDAATRKSTFVSPAGRTGTITLDARGLMTRAQLTGLEPVVFGYSANGRISTVTEGSGAAARTTTLTYGSAGPLAAYLARIDDALGRQTSFGYDLAGRATQQTLPGVRIIGYGYDGNGNLTSLTPPGRAAHTFAYTNDQQLASYTPPAVTGGGGPITYAYDSLGRLTQLNQADGQAVVVAYDAAGRPTRLTQAGRIIDVTYQGNTANIQTIAGPAGQQFAYGSDGTMLISQIWSGPVAGTVSRTLDNGLRTATRTVNAAAISLAYDQDSLLTGAGALTLARDPNHGLVSGTTLGNVTDARTYTGFGGLAGFTARFSGTPFWDIQYTRDPLGRITIRSETINGITDSYAYAYDAAGRLAQVQKNGATTHTYSYDTNGNRLSANAVVSSYDGQDRQTQAGATTFAYTLNGELQAKTAAGGTTTYLYDAIGNLLNVSLPGPIQVEYLFDGLSHRIGKKVGGTLIQGWLYDERSRIAAELDGAGAVVSRFVYASRPNVPDYMVKSGAPYRLVGDHLGTVRFVVKADDGTIAQQLDYDPFGNVISDTAPGFQPFGFAGGLYDRDTRLGRFGARDYHPETGRWTTKDPILFAGGDTNLYAYVSNDPVNRHDSNGLDGPSDGGVCLGPPPDLNLGKPLFLDKTPQPPLPPLCPTCAVPAAPSGGAGSGRGGGPLSFGPFTFSGKLNTPGLDDLRDWNPRSLFDKYQLKLDAPLNPDFTLPNTPKTPGGPDPNGPNPKPQGPQCNREPEHDPGFTSCQ